ncbi:MAG: hypothetical protein ACXVHO_07895 [Methanobacterium sp.]
MLETPQERVKLLKAGIDGKTIEKLYIIYNNFKIASSPILFDMDMMELHPPVLKKKNKNDICLGVKMFFLAYVCGTFSIILRSVFPNYSPLIILIASSILIYFIIWTKRETDWNLLIHFLRKNTTRYTA